MRTLGHRSDAAVLLLESVHQIEPTGSSNLWDITYWRTHRSGLDVVSIRGMPVGVQADERSSASTRSANNAISSILAVL